MHLIPRPLLSDVKENGKIAKSRRGGWGEKEAERKEGSEEGAGVLKLSRSFHKLLVHLQPLNGWHPALGKQLSLTAIYASTDRLVGYT